MSDLPFYMVAATVLLNCIIIGVLDNKLEAANKLYRNVCDMSKYKQKKSGPTVFVDYADDIEKLSLVLGEGAAEEKDIG